MSVRNDILEFPKDSDTSAHIRAEAVQIDNLERYLTIEEVLGIPPAGDRFQHCCCVATEAQIGDQLREA